jgi:hypothetical protein
MEIAKVDRSADQIGVQLSLSVGIIAVENAVGEQGCWLAHMEER